MDYDTFINTVRTRGRLASCEAAVTATRATLETLGERLYGGELKDVCAQLPRKIAYYVSRVTRTERLSLQDFYGRVAVREPCEFPRAVFHARVVMSVLELELSAGEFHDVRAQLPAEYDALFDAREFVPESPMASVPGREQS